MLMNKADSPIEVNVRTEYAAEHSDPDQDRYVFIYYISIINRGDQAAQLIERYWKITDGTGHIEEVRGEGVVGEQPVIEPGKEHFYNSFCAYYKHPSAVCRAAIRCAVKMDSILMPRSRPFHWLSRDA